MPLVFIEYQFSQSELLFCMLSQRPLRKKLLFIQEDSVNSWIFLATEMAECLPAAWWLEISRWLIGFTIITHWKTGYWQAVDKKFQGKYFSKDLNKIIPKNIGRRQIWEIPDFFYHKEKSFCPFKNDKKKDRSKVFQKWLYLLKII